MRIAQIKYQRAPRSAETHSPGREDSRHVIIDECMVACHGIVSEYRDRLMGFRQSLKLPVCQIRPLVRARQEPQANHRHSVKMSIRLGKRILLRDVVAA